MKRLVMSVLALVFVAMAAGSTTFFLQTKAEYDQRKTTAHVTAERLRIAQDRLQAQEDLLQRMRSDPAFVELMIRRRLGYAKADELVFRFEN